MKKVLALVLAVVMCVGMASVAFGISTTKTFDRIEYLSSDDNYANYQILEDGTIAYVAGDTFYLFPVIEGTSDSGAIINLLEGDATGASAKLTSAEVKQGSTTVYAPAVLYDNDGNQPTYRWMVQMKTADIAAVKEYDTKLVIKGEYGADTYEQTITLVTKDYDMIDENDINEARMNDEDVNTLDLNGNYRYVVSADAFKAIKSGETFRFPYENYTLVVGSGIENALNFRASTEKIDNLVEKYGEDKVLGVLDFKDKNDLPVTIGVEMECTEYSSTHTTNKAYVYRIEGDNLVLVTDAATYDAAREMVTFETNKLGTLIVSSEALPGATTSDTTTTTTDSSKTNPGTGSNDVIGLAIAGAVVAAAAGFVALKK